MDWASKVCDIGKRILNTYKKDEYRLDAIMYKDKRNYTMYFPIVG